MPALIIEKLDGGLRSALVSPVLTHMARALILPPECVHPVDVPFTSALNVR